MNRVEIRVRLAGGEIAKWARSRGMKHLGPMGDEVAKGMYVSYANTPTYVDVGWCAESDLPYVGRAEIEIVVAAGALTPEQLAHRREIPTVILNALYNAGVPIDSIEAIAIDMSGLDALGR